MKVGGLTSKLTKDHDHIKDHIYCIGEIDHAVATLSECPIECSTITYNKHIIFDGPHEHNIGLFSY